MVALVYSDLCTLGEQEAAPGEGSRADWERNRTGGGYAWCAEEPLYFCGGTAWGLAPSGRTFALAAAAAVREALRSRQAEPALARRLRQAGVASLRESPEPAGCQISMFSEETRPSRAAL